MPRYHCLRPISRSEKDPKKLSLNTMDHIFIRISETLQDPGLDIQEDSHSSSSDSDMESTFPKKKKKGTKAKKATVKDDARECPSPKLSAQRQVRHIVNILLQEGSSKHQTGLFP